ncbi:MAG: hypothetical protein C4555_04540 [Dehalococcoidia bacterium]|nr:MAG: hypothetical protein C4555_04540 [Dehalococcoidia bacterium]
MEDLIPQSAIDSVAQHINLRTNKQYPIPTVGDESNSETPQIFEIIPFDQIDDTDLKFFAVDGSDNSHSFYNGVTIGLYRGGYVCFDSGKQIRLNNYNDPVILGQSYTPQNILITCDQHLSVIYDELIALPTVKRFLDFLKPAGLGDIFPYTKEAVCTTISTLLSFCQEILEWSLIFEIACRPEVKEGDFILKDGTLRSLNIKQEYLVKLGDFLSNEKKLIIVGITKNSPIKIELSYTFKQIDGYLQDKLRPSYPFKETDPKSQKLCCWFEVPDNVLLNSYGSGSMFVKKGITGGRGFGLFFAARLDYVEKLQNYDWVVADVNIFDAIPGIKQNVQTRNISKLKEIFYNLTRLTQEHYILGYPYPLVEAHNFVTLKADFKEEVINRVKHSMYLTQRMDNVDIENMFLDIHSRF